jgi:hypothetical protein
VGQAGAGNHDGQVRPKARHSGQILSKSHRVTSTEPGGPPPRSTATTLTDLDPPPSGLPGVGGGGQRRVDPPHLPRGRRVDLHGCAVLLRSRSDRRLDPVERRAAEGCRAALQAEEPAAVVGAHKLSRRARCNGECVRIRKLNERRKLSDSLAAQRLIVRRHEPIGRAPDIWSRHEIWKHYNLDRGTNVEISLADLCNQFIHSWVWQISASEGDELNGIFVSSDRQRGR